MFEYNVLHMIARFSNLTYFTRTLDVLQKGALEFYHEVGFANIMLIDIVNRKAKHILGFLLENQHLNAASIAHFRNLCSKNLAFLPKNIRIDKNLIYLKDQTEVDYIKNFLANG